MDMDRMVFFFFFQAEDGIRDAQESRGLGDVYKRQYQRRVRGKMRATTWIAVILLLSATEAAPKRWVSFWYAPAANDLNQTIDVLTRNKDAVSSVMLYCGHSVSGTGKLVGSVSPLCVGPGGIVPALRAHETPEHLVCRLLLEKKKKKPFYPYPCDIYPTNQHNILYHSISTLSIPTHPISITHA
eukprot:TRINITY_DN3751_c0_g1_i6.p1 TRINITY_DN3751_c0_g1~~TRINITY_DN3751_c0_g1_i6.p1  ORF type:complete len:185 (-),score=41.79 TRINITY_DN3751_c0_g1_i6:53-607(-)